MSYIDQRREYTLVKFEKLQEQLDKAREIVSGSACVYATGSFGRLEAGKQSDLDVFIVCKSV